jgi:hypothetical protein
VNIIAGHYGTAHYKVTCPTFDSDDRLKVFDLSSDNDEELPALESISVCHPAAFSYRLSEKMGVRFDAALTYVLAEILSPLRKRLTLYTRRARNCEMAEMDGHAVRAGYGNNEVERLWSEVGGEYSKMPLSYQSAVTEGRSILGRMGYAAVIANIMEAHDCSEKEARTIFAQIGYEARTRKRMDRNEISYDEAKRVGAREAYKARVQVIVDEHDCTYNEAKSESGRIAKAGVSEAQLAIHGVKLSVTQFRKGLALAKERLIELRGMDTFPGRGNNRKLYKYLTERRRCLIRAIAQIQEADSNDYNAGLDRTRTYDADLAFLESILSEQDNACSEVRRREASRNQG